MTRALGSCPLNADDELMTGDPGDVTQAPWVHGTRLGREHRSVRQHLVEDHGADRDWARTASDGAIHGRHDGKHHTVWAYAEDLPHEEAQHDPAG